MTRTNIKDSELILHVKSVRKALRIPIPIDNQIAAFCQQEKMNFSAGLLQLVQKGLKQAITEKSTFYCQSCRNEYPVRKMHYVPIGIEMFVFCDNCFFSEQYKQFIRNIL